MLFGILLSLYILPLKCLSSFYPFIKKSLARKQKQDTQKHEHNMGCILKEIFAILPISQDRLLKIYFTVKILSL